jgi:protein O-mannosyl-transferase
MSKKQLSVPVKNNIIRNYYILIAALSFLVYVNTINYGFVLDDVAVIESNKFVKEGVKGIPDILTTFYWKGFWDSNAGLYRPVSLISFALEYQLSPENPFIHHLFNVLYYVVTCCLLFEVLCRLFKKVDPLFFLFVVLLFIVHPIHTEVVANIKSRDEIFALLFFLLCCKQLYSDKQNKTKTIILPSFFFLLSLLSKEGAIVFLPVIFFIDYLNEKKIAAVLQKRIPIIVTSFLWLAIHQLVISSSSSPKITYTYSDNSLFASSSFIDQKATAFGMFVRYIVKAFYPYQLSYDYSFNEFPIQNFASPSALAGLVLFFALIYFAIKYYNKNTLLTFSILLIILPLLLTGNLLFNIGSTMADRFLFIPTIGSCIIICLLIYRLAKADIASNKKNNVIIFSITAIVLVFSIKTFIRNKDWKSDATLFSKDVTAVPNSARVHYNYGTVLLGKGTDLNACRKEYETCLRIDPKYQDALINLGSVYTKQKDFDAALKLYHRALAQQNNNATIFGNIGDTFYRKGNNDSAIFYLEKAQLAGNKTAATYNVLGTAFFGNKRYAEAVSAYENGIRRDPNNWNLYLNYGNALAVSNKFPEALKAFQSSYNMNPGNIQTLYFIALTYNNLGDTLNAKKYFDEFQKLNK